MARIDTKKHKATIQEGEVKLLDEGMTINEKVEELNLAESQESISELAKRVARFNEEKLNLAKKVHAGSHAEFTIEQQYIIADRDLVV